MATQLQKIQQALAKVEEDIEATKEELRGIVTQIPFWAPEKWLEATEFILNLEPIDLDTKSPSPTIHTLIETVLSYPEIKVAKTTKQDSHLNLLRLVCRTEEDIREIIEQIRESEATEDPQEEALRIQNLRLRKGCIIAREIVKHGNGKVFDELHLTQSQNLFHIAAQSNAHHILEELLAEALLVKDRGFLYGLLRKRSTLGWTPLGQALSQRHLPTIQLLAPYNDGDTLSHIRNAAGGGNVEILKAVLPESYPNFKALIESATRDQMPLAVAIDKSDTLSVEYLCKSQFDDGYLQSHIFSAATTGKLKVLEKLLAGKTDVTNLLTIDVFEVVAKKGYKDVWELLISRNGACVKDSQLLHIAVEASQIEIITSLIQIEPGLLKVRDAMKRPISQCGEQTEGIQMLLLDGMVRNFSPLEIKQLCTKPNETPKEVFLDLNILNLRTGNFSRFLEIANADVETYAARLREYDEKFKEAERIEEAEKLKRKDKETIRRTGSNDEYYVRPRQEAGLLPTSYPPTSIYTYSPTSNYPYPPTSNYYKSPYSGLYLESYSDYSAPLPVSPMPQTRVRLPFEDGVRVNGSSSEQHSQIKNALPTLAYNLDDDYDRERRRRERRREQRERGENGYGYWRAQPNPFMVPVPPPAVPGAMEAASAKKKVKLGKRPKPAPSKYRVEFQPKLKYVAFPDLDLGHSSRDIAFRSKEVKIILDWLWEIKGVRKILQLRVLDSWLEPHSEEVIEQAISRFNVETLNWRRTDLSIKSVVEAAKGVSELHLYSSGSWMALDHWMNEKTFSELPKLKTIKISIITDLISTDRAEQQVKDLETWRQTSKFSSSPSVMPVPWKTAGPREIDQEHPLASRDPQTVTKLRSFIQTYRNRQTAGKKTPAVDPVKVAIIDTGVDESEFPGDGDCFIGCSFVQKGDTESHWWLTSDVHGTQMAKFVRQLDPFCQLYIAKVSDHKSNLEIGRVIEAISWAREEKVDIISMSFALDDTSDKLKELSSLVSDAAAEGIVLICSTKDEGNNQGQVYPADCGKLDDTFKIAACDGMGFRASYSYGGAQFWFQGDDIDTDILGISKSQTKVSGSSVATAVAAGVASLLLACCRLDEDTVIPRERKDEVRQWFERMKGKHNPTKYVKPWEVFGQKDKGAGNDKLLPRDNFQ